MDSNYCMYVCMQRINIHFFIHSFIHSTALCYVKWQSRRAMKTSPEMKTTMLIATVMVEMTMTCKVAKSTPTGGAA